MTTPNTSSKPLSANIRKIKFASRDKAKKAGAWALKKYASVFKRLAHQVDTTRHDGRTTRIQ